MDRESERTHIWRDKTKRKEYTFRDAERKVK